MTRPQVDQRLDQAHREGALVDGFVAAVGEREHYAGLSLVRPPISVSV